MSKMNRQYNDQKNKHKKKINVLRNLTQKTINQTWDEQTIQWPKKQAQKDNKCSTKPYTENYKSNMRWTDNTMIKRKSIKRQ